MHACYSLSVTTHWLTSVHILKLAVARQHIGWLDYTLATTHWLTWLHVKSFPISSWHQDIEQKFHSLPVRKLARKWKWFFIYFVERAPTHKWLRLHDHAPDTKIYKDVEVLKKDYKSLPCWNSSRTWGIWKEVGNLYEYEIGIYDDESESYVT